MRAMDASVLALVVLLPSLVSAMDQVAEAKQKISSLEARIAMWKKDVLDSRDVKAARAKMEKSAADLEKIKADKAVSVSERFNAMNAHSTVKRLYEDTVTRGELANSDLVKARKDLVEARSNLDALSAA